MYAIEFNAKSKRGMIEIPEKYRNIIKGMVHIIILKKDNYDQTIENKKIIKNQLLQIQRKDIFEKIEDPVKWQREIRNEWN